MPGLRPCTRSIASLHCLAYETLAASLVSWIEFTVCGLQLCCCKDARAHGPQQKRYSFTTSGISRSLVSWELQRNDRSLGS